jgi:hypothetical protein
MPKDDWMSADEAIDQIMRSTGCSRRQARKKLANHMKKGDLRFKEALVPVPEDKILPGPEAAELMRDEPEFVYITLYYLKEVYDFSGEELQRELASGRLKAFPLNDSVMLRAELTNKVDSCGFGVSGAALTAWMLNPKTPPHLRAKIKSRTIS